MGHDWCLKSWDIEAFVTKNSKHTGGKEMHGEDS